MRRDHERLDRLPNVEGVEVTQALGLLLARRRGVEDRIDEHQARKDLASLLRPEPADDAREEISLLADRVVHELKASARDERTEDRSRGP